MTGFRESYDGVEIDSQNTNENSVGETMDYTAEQIADVLDYAALNPCVGIQAIVMRSEFCTEYGIKCFCCSSANVRTASNFHSNVASVIGFPHGNVSVRAKLEEAKFAIGDGAKELDVVINYGLFNTGETGIIRAELDRLCTFAHHHGVIVKAILETCTMTLGQVELACKECIKAEVDYVKTSTGFGTLGAQVDKVQRMLKVCKGTGVKVKASGGIKTYRDAKMFLDMGVARLGSSKYLELLQ
jgi:deoxyribose-phosphate aldolase